MASEDLDLENATKENLPLTPEGMAAEWAAMPDIAPDESEPEAHIDRLMTQDEIDTMLGFSAGEDGKGGRNGIQAIVDSGSVTYERLPMLEIIFERLVRLLLSLIHI